MTHSEAFKTKYDDFPYVQKDYVLKVATKPMNNTICENGLVPPGLLFVIIPHFQTLYADLPV